MKNHFNPRNFTLLFAGLIGAMSLSAQQEATVSAIDDDISQNLDLEAVASVFADSKDLADFEERLNDPELQISNLDLNGDDYVDYLRVMESAEGDTHVVAIQAVLGDDLYQDVATIELENSNDNVTLQIVGDTYLFGPAVIVEPVYAYRPPIFGIFWRPFYRPYRSVYYWGYYPRYFRPWRPFRTRVYRTNVHVHVNVKHVYHRTTVRRSTRAVTVHKTVRRNDYAVRYPEKSYTTRVTTTSRSNGSTARMRTVKQADGDIVRTSGVNRADGTKRRSASVDKADGTRKRAVGVNQADGDKYRAAGVKTSEGTTKRAAGVNKADGTKKRVASVKNPDGSGRTVAVKKNPNGSRSAVSVKKNADGSKSVKKSKRSGKKSRTKTKKAKKNSSRRN